MTVDRYRDICARHRWNVPHEFNIAAAVCGRHASDGARVAIYWEDESGATTRLSFGELQRQANRCANALASLGVGRGDKIAIMLPQRPETAIAHIACYQLGAIAVPLSFLFGPDALEYRLQNSEAAVAIVDPASLPNLAPIRDRLPALRHAIGVAGAREAWLLDWDHLLQKAPDQFSPVTTRATDPAILVYTSGTTGPPKGALMPQQCLLGNLPGFVYSHDEFPKAGDVFWSPADWAWTGGLMDALLPTLYFGCPVVGYRGRFDPERALALIAKYRVRNTFLFPTALKMMMKAVPRPRQRYDLDLRSMMSAGEAVGTTVFGWTQEALGVTINEMFGQTEMNYIVGNSHTLWPAKPGSMGRPYPGHRIAVLDDEGRPSSPARWAKWRSTALRPIRRWTRSSFSSISGILRRPPKNSAATGAAPAIWRRRTTMAISGTRAAPTTCSRPPVIASVRPKSRIVWCGTRRWPMPRSFPVPMRRAAT